MVKKIVGILGVFLLVIPLLVSAQETEVNAGITPDSPLYELDVFIDRIRVRLATSEENRAMIRLNIAEERIAEVEKMIEKGNGNARERAMEEHREQVRNLETAQLNEQVRAQVQERLRKHTQTLERVRENAPEEAKQGINTAIENSKRASERVGNPNG